MEMEMVLSCSSYSYPFYIHKKLLSSMSIHGRLSNKNINNNNNNKKNSLITKIIKRKQKQQVRCKCLLLEIVIPSDPYSIPLPIITSASYGALLLAAALFAYTRSGSKGSLYGGLSGASLMAAAFILMQSSETREIGEALAFGSALLFTFVFGIRLAATRKIIPAAPLLALSVGASVVFISAYLQDNQSLM